MGLPNEVYSVLDEIDHGLDDAVARQIIKSFFYELNSVMSNGYVPEIRIAKLFRGKLTISLLDKKIKALIKEMRNIEDINEYEEKKKILYVLWKNRRYFKDNIYYKLRRTKSNYGTNEFRKEN